MWSRKITSSVYIQVVARREDVRVCGTDIVSLVSAAAESVRRGRRCEKISSESRA